jgi:hypothetical protein
MEGCKKDEGTSHSNSGGLIGTWTIASIDGKPTSYVSTFQFTSDNVTAIKTNCIEVSTYSIIQDTITITVISVTGSSCGNRPGDHYSYKYVLAGDQLSFYVLSSIHLYNCVKT